MMTILRQRLHSYLTRSALLVFLACLALDAHATNYYVDSTNGSDSNNGTSTSTAWKTLTKPNTTSFNGGDNLLFIYGGVWTGQLTITSSGSSATAPITIGAYGNNTQPLPLINGAGGTAAILLEGPSSGPNAHTLKYVIVNYMAVTNYDGMNITDGAEGVRSGIYVGIYSDTSLQYITIDHNQIYYVEGCSNAPKDGYPPRGTILNPLQYNEDTGAAIYTRAVSTANMTISNNYVHDCTGPGISVSPNTNTYAGTTGTLITGNTVQNVGCDGIVVGWSTSPVVEYNSCIGVANNSMGGTWPVAGYIGFHGYAAAGMWAYDSSNVLFQYNYCQGTHVIDYDGQPWDFDLNLTGTCIYQYNFSRDNPGGFLLSQKGVPGLTRICRFNISVNDGAGVSGGEGYFDNCEYYYNNIFYQNNGAGFVMPSTAITASFQNNIFDTNATTNITYQTPTVIFSNNCFYGHTPASPGTSPILSDPLFVDVADAASGMALDAESGFQLKNGSMCIGAGLLVSNDGGLDYWGDTLSTSTMDIGASAYLSQPILAPGYYTLTPGSLAGFRMDAWQKGGAGSIVDMYSPNGTSAQTWLLSNLGGNVYEISPSYNTSLAVTTSGTASGSGLSLANYTGADTQEWDLTPGSGGTFTLTPLNAGGQFISAPNSGANGTQLVTYAASGNYAQSWTFNLAPAAAPTFSVGSNTTSVLQFSVMASSTSPGATIYYTTDGSTPTTNSPSVLSGGMISIAKSETLKALASASGYTLSTVTTANYYVTGALTAGDSNTMALQSNGTVWIWGSGGTHVPAQVSGLSNIISISSAHGNQFAVKSDGTFWDWGSNSYYVLGNGNSSPVSNPTQITSLSNMTQVAAGEYFTVALRSDGTVWTWGNNGDGQLGNGTTTASESPVEVQASYGVNLTGVVAVGAGGYTAYAIKSDGSLWAWGRGGNGEIGNGGVADEYYPVQVASVSNVTDVTGNYYSAAAVKSDGTVWCWGMNSSGQCGDGTTTQRNSPVQASGLSSITRISASPAAYHVVALKSDGSVWAWGLNSYGALGIGTTTQSNVPVEVQASSGVNFASAMAIAGGAYHSVAAQTNGSVSSWGLNSSGQLGNNTTTNSSYPVQSSGITIALLKGWYHHAIIEVEKLFAVHQPPEDVPQKRA